MNEKYIVVHVPHIAYSSNDLEATKENARAKAAIGGCDVVVAEVVFLIKQKTAEIKQKADKEELEARPKLCPHCRLEGIVMMAGARICKLCGWFAKED